MPKPLTKDERDLARKVRKHLRVKTLGKLHYEEADQILVELLEDMADPAKFSLRLLRSGKKLAKIKDNFASSNTAFRSHGIKRFELEVVELP